MQAASFSAFSLAFSFSSTFSSFSSVATISATWLVEMWTSSLSTSSMTCAHGRGHGAQAALPLTAEAPLRAQPAGHGDWPGRPSALSPWGLGSSTHAGLLRTRPPTPRSRQTPEPRPHTAERGAPGAGGPRSQPWEGYQLGLPGPRAAGRWAAQLRGCNSLAAWPLGHCLWPKAMRVRMTVHTLRSCTYPAPSQEEPSVARGSLIK